MITELVKLAANAVAQSMQKRPPSARDGIWRFDGIVQDVFGQRSKLEWDHIHREACLLQAGRDTWDESGYGIVASFAAAKVAYMTPGFAELRRQWMD